MNGVVSDLSLKRATEISEIGQQIPSLIRDRLLHLHFLCVLGSNSTEFPSRAVC